MLDEDIRKVESETPIGKRSSKRNRPMTDYTKPHEVDAVTFAFPANLGDLLPAQKELPKEYRQLRSWGCKRAEALFFGMLKTYGDIGKVKEGLDFNLCVRHLMTVLRSFEPKHEHKIAGAGYLIEQWFEPHGEGND